MLRNTIFLFALVPLAYATLQPLDHPIRRDVNSLAAEITNQHILDAFIEAGHPNALAEQSWKDDQNNTYQELFTFDPEDWDDMHHNLLERAGASWEEAHHIVTRSASTNALEARDGDPPTWLCKGYNSAPFAYTFTLGQVGSLICAGIGFGAEKAGKKQVLQRTGLQDVNGGPLKVTLTYTWKAVKWASVSSCGISVSYGITTACQSIEDGIEGKKEASNGYSNENYDDGGLVSSLDLTPA